MHTRNTAQKTFSAAALLLVFLFYFAGTQLFVHTHDIGGQKYTHSHPYRGESSAPHHNHTGSQIQTIAHLDHWASEQASASFFPLMQEFLSALRLPHLFFRCFPVPFSFHGRAPPSFLSFPSFC